MSNPYKSDSQIKKSEFLPKQGKKNKKTCQQFFALHRPKIKEPENHLIRNENFPINKSKEDTINSIKEIFVNNNDELSRNLNEENKSEKGIICTNTVMINKVVLQMNDGQQRKKLKLKKSKNPVKKEGNFNTGRWTQEEHRRFIEAIMKYGNEWKNVQKLVKTRSSTQARSHAQKFFYKIKKNNIMDLDIDLDKNSIKSLHEFANTLDENQYLHIINSLNLMAYEKLNAKTKTTKTKYSEDNSNFNDFQKNISLEEENISIYKEIKDSISEMTSGSSMNNNKPNLVIIDKDDQINFLDNYSPLQSEDNRVFNVNPIPKKTIHYFTNYTLCKKEIKSYQNQLEENTDNESDFYIKEAKRKLSFESSFNIFFKNNNKISFSDDESENLKLFSAENSNTLPLRKSVSEKFKNIDDKKTKTNIFKSFPNFQRNEINKSVINNNFSSSPNNINKLKNKKLFVINNIENKKKTICKMKNNDKKKMKFITHTVSFFLK